MPQTPRSSSVHSKTADSLDSGEKKKPRGSACHKQVTYKLIPVKFILLENNKKREALRCMLCCYLCALGSVTGAAPCGGSSQPNRDLAEGLLAGDRDGPCPGSYLDFNSLSQKAMDQWLHQGEGDDLSTADLG